MAHGERDEAVKRCACIAFWLLIASAAQAQPWVRVQAGTEVVLHGTHGAHGLDLRGALVDDLGAPLAGRTLEVWVAVDADPGSERRLDGRSGDDGSFRVAAQLAAGHYRVRIRFAGDGHHAASESARVVDLTRADVRLGFIEPRALRLDLDAESHAIAVRASSAQGGGGLRIEVQDERGTALARGSTDADGVFRATVASTALGAPGSGKLIARSEADALRGAAQAEAVVLRWRGTLLQLNGRVESERGALVLQGMLRDSLGGLGGEAIGLFDGEAHIATVLTDRAGRFHADLPFARAREPHTLSVHARFESDAAWVGSSRSAVVELALAPEASPSPLWLLAPLCASALLVWLLLRRPAAERAASAIPSAVGVGIHPGGRTRGRAERREIAGTVRDAASERPVLGAVISLVGRAGTTLTLATDREGRFRSSELEDADFALTITAAGYAPLHGTLAIPHRGEWSDVQVQLQSLRSAAVQAYKPAALRVLPNAELWQRWTLRETLENAQKSGRATEPFVQLTLQVEHAAYARTPPSADDVAAIDQVAHEALARFPSAPSQSAGSGLVRATIPHRR